MQAQGQPDHGGTYSQNFDTLSNTAGSTNTAFPIGWQMTETGGGARDNEAIRGRYRQQQPGGTYSYGAAAAPTVPSGGLRSGSLVGVRRLLHEWHRRRLSSFAVAYTGERWRPVKLPPGAPTASTSSTALNARPR